MVEAELTTDNLVKMYASVFTPGLGLIKGFQAKLSLGEGSLAVFCKTRPVPYATRARVIEELQCLQADGVLMAVTQSDWATPLVVVEKPENKVRLCRYSKVTGNLSLKGITTHCQLLKTYSRSLQEEKCLLFWTCYQRTSKLSCILTHGPCIL